MPTAAAIPAAPENQPKVIDPFAELREIKYEAAFKDDKSFNAFFEALAERTREPLGALRRMRQASEESMRGRWVQ